MPTLVRPAFFAARARASAAGRPPPSGSDTSTSVYPVLSAGQAASAFGFAAGTVPVGRVPLPGAVGSGPVVIVGCAVGMGSVAGALVTGTGAWVAPGPSGTLTFVATIGRSDSWADFAASASAVAATVRIRKRRTGQIQSPGYHANRRCQAAASTPTTPWLTGSRAPHSRQYSWLSSYATPQLGQ